MLQASALSVERLMAPCRRTREGELAADGHPGPSCANRWFALRYRERTGFIEADTLRRWVSMAGDSCRSPTATDVHTPADGRPARCSIEALRVAKRVAEIGASLCDPWVFT